LSAAVADSEIEMTAEAKRLVRILCFIAVTSVASNLQKRVRFVNARNLQKHVPDNSLWFAISLAFPRLTKRIGAIRVFHRPREILISMACRFVGCIAIYCDFLAAPDCC
jgi:hypothetical protein